jgi:hypothetical protein
MKDVAGSGKIPNGLVCGDLAKRHSKMFSVMLALTLIALVAFAAFLVFDIMSFKSNASYEKSLSVFSFMDSKENGIAIKDQQDDAIDLANQGKDQEPVRVLEDAAASNSSREDKGTPEGMPPSSLNGSEAAKGSLAGGNTGKRKRPGPTAGANSLLNNTSTLTDQTARTAVAIIKPPGSDSHRSDKNKKHSFSKNDIQVNALSPSSTTAENQSQLNQSQKHANLSVNLSLAHLKSHTNLSSMDLSSQSQSRINLSSNHSMNLSAPDSEMNSAETPSYNLHLEDTDISFGDSPANSSANSSANPDALSQLDTNPTVSSYPNVFDASLTTAANFSAKLNVGEMSSVDNKSLNLDVNAAMGPEEKAQVEPSDLGYLEYDTSYEGIPDGLVNINSDTGTNNVEVFADPFEANDNALLPDDVLSEPQHPEHSIAADGEGPVNSQKEPAQFVGSQEDESVKGDLDFTESTSKVVPADKSSYEWQGAENKRISNRDRRDKLAKYLKRPTPPAKPARTKPVKPARENPRDRR